MCKKLYLLLFVFSAILFSVFKVNAQNYNLSPAIEIIKSSSEIKKCGIINVPIDFSQSDFDTVLDKAEYITFSTIPPKTMGTLTLGGHEIKKGQTISRSSLNGLCFIPFTNTTGETSFAFCDASKESEKSGICTIFILEEPNLSPTTKDCSFDTLKNITHKGYLLANDAEGDAISFSIVSSCRHGTLKLLDKNTGYFMYTPKEDFTGRDIFKFRVFDKYGNKSETQKVTIHVNESENETVFYDLTNHWAHKSAIKATADGFFGGEIIDGKLCFSPDKTISRGDFLAISMIGAGLEESITKNVVSSFADDFNIPHNIKSYVAFALQSGFIKGYEKNEQVIFESNSPITRQEAAMILSRMLLPQDTEISENDLFDTLRDIKIISGTSPYEYAPDEFVTRAQAAEIYCNLKEYCEEKNQKEQESKKNIYNLFGLIK